MRETVHLFRLHRASARLPLMSLPHAWSACLSVTFAAAVATAGAAPPIVVGFERFHAADPNEAARTEGGLLLLNELNCVACHAVPGGWRERIPGRGRISLGGIGDRLPAAALAAFIAAPADVKPGTIMPHVGIGAAEAEALAAYLGSLPAPSTAVPELPPGDGERGRAVFERVGCVACHAPSVPRGTATSVPLALARHSDRRALAAFLLDPLRTRPAGRMPATDLSPAEAADLAAYLSPDAPPSPAHPLALRREIRSAGRTAYATRNCAACHETTEPISPRSARPLSDARADHGCLTASPGPREANYALSPNQRQALQAAIEFLQRHAEPAPLTAEERIAVTFTRLNCYACHEWRGRGGVEAGRTPFFVPTDPTAESLGEIGHLPPRLDAAGRKLTPAWLARLLHGHGGGVRPYLGARMPRFGTEATPGLVEDLIEACRPARPQEIDVSGGKGHQRFATGRTLLGTGPGGLGCVACHGIKHREPAGLRVVDLTHTARRLQPEYFKALLLDPQGVQPGTFMPPLLAGRANADKEVESIWTYFKELDQSNVLPEGLAVPGSFELKPETDGTPIVFRTFLEGAGTQAIAVGFPARVHAAFDAYEVRWALAWRGRFLDAQSNWEERAMKPVKPLGESSRSLPAHMPLARLASPAAPWPSACGTVAGYVFQGYRLSSDGTPVLRYSVGTLEVEDCLRPTPDGSALHRTLTARGDPGEAAPWYFRGLAGGAVSRPLAWREGVATLEETILP